MVAGLAALILLRTVYFIQTAETSHQMSLTVVELGGNVTLECPFSGKEGKFLLWVKLPLGNMVQTVASGTYSQAKLSEQFNDSRFKITEGEAHYLLAIRNVNKEDEATYLCQTGSAYEQKSLHSIFLAVNDHNQQKSVNVIQSPKTASVELNDPVTLQCSVFSKDRENRDQCPGEHSVFWIRAGSGGFHPAIIYNHSHTERSCVYSLSKTIRNSSDTGTYYCAVDKCGRILFGEGTKVEIRPKLDPVVFVLGALLACCVTVIVVLIFYATRRRVCEHCKGVKSAYHNPDHDSLTVDQSIDLDGDTEEVNYAALDFSTRKVKRVRTKKESPQDCVYSSVRGDHHT